jgi:cell division protein FtsL
MLSHRNGYLIVPPVAVDDESRKASIVRTFLVGETQDRTKLLQREVLVTTALIEGAGPLSYLKFFDSAGAVNPLQLSDKLGIETDEIDLRSIVETKLPPEADCDGHIDFAIAYGAALALSDKGRSVDFREDFSPFQGKKLRQQKTLKTAAISVTILLVAVGLYFHTQLFSVNRNKNNLRSKFAKDYKEVMFEQLPVKSTIKEAVRKLGELTRSIKKGKQGLTTDEKSISSNLTLLLAAFNKCARQADLNIDTINITTKAIIVSGDTSNKQSRGRVFGTIRSSGFEIKQDSSDFKDNRESFRITVAPKT